MKILYLFCLFVICCLTMSAQEQYVVTANTFLNIRSSASTTAPVAGRINKGEKVAVHEIKNGWAKISHDGTFAYVNANYIQPANQSSGESTISSNKINWDFSKGFNFNPESKARKDLVYVILFFAFVLYLIRIKRGDDDTLEGGLYITNWLIFLIMSGIELLYVISRGTESIWFCKPDTVGWMWTIINFLIFGFVVYNQFICYFNTLEDLRENTSADFNLKWGLYSWPIGIAATIACSIFFAPGLLFVGIAFVIVQIVQIVIIFSDVLSNSNWSNAILCAVFYIVGSLATAAILIYFMTLLIIVLIAWLILAAIGNSGTKTQRCSTCSRMYGSSYCPYIGKYIDNPKTSGCRNHL